MFADILPSLAKDDVATFALAIVALLFIANQAKAFMSQPKIDKDDLPVKQSELLVHLDALNNRIQDQNVKIAELTAYTHTSVHDIRNGMQGVALKLERVIALVERRSFNQPLTADKGQRGPDDAT